MEKRTTQVVNKMKSLLAIGLLLAQLTAPTWAGPSSEDLDYSFSRPLLVETRLVNGIFFEIISPKDRFANFEGVPYMAEMYTDNLLMISGHTDSGLIETHRTEGSFSFDVMDEIEEKFGKNEEGYVIVKEWGGGRDMTYHVYATKEGFKQILRADRASDIYEIVAPNQLKFFVLNVDIQGLEKCSMAQRPYDHIIYTFFPQKTVKERIKAEIPECAKAVSG